MVDRWLDDDRSCAGGDAGYTPFGFAGFEWMSRMSP
jgi:hypothetical protein